LYSESFRDFFGYYAVGEEGQAVWFDVESRAVLDQRDQAPLVGLPSTEHVDVYGGAATWNPDCLQQQSALQNHSLRMRRFRDAVEKALDSVLLQYLLKG
jgi:hypothetical protein